MPTTAQTPHRPATIRTAALWLACGAVAAAGLSVAAAILPEGLRKLLLLPALLGAGTGFALIWLGGEFPVRSRRLRIVAAFLLAVAATAHLGWLNSRQFRATREQEAAKDPQQESMLEMVSAGEKDPVNLAKYDAQRRVWHPHFEDYLAHHAKGLGAWAAAAPWPGILWGAELLLAGAVSALLVAWRTSPAPDHPATADAT